MIQALGKNKNKDNLLVIHIQIVFRECVRGRNSNISKCQY